MKCSIPLAMMLVASAASGILAQKINADEIKWTNQRINDNKGEEGAQRAAPPPRHPAAASARGSSRRCCRRIRGWKVEANYLAAGFKCRIVMRDVTRER